MIARDPLGSRAVFVNAAGRAGERARPLCEGSPRLDRDGIRAAWGESGLSRHSCFAGVRRVPPGHRLRDDGAVEAVPLPPPPPSLETALRLALAPLVHGKVALWLSGGLDSALLLALLCEMQADVHAYILSPDFSRDYDESAAAAALARAFSVEATLVRATAGDFLHALPATIRATEAPLWNLHLVQKRILAERTRADGFARALTGDGADECFAPAFADDYLPLANAIARDAGVALQSPFLDERVVAWARAQAPDPRKKALRAIARTLPLPQALCDADKQPRLAPALDVSRFLDGKRVTQLAATLELPGPRGADDVKWATLSILAGERLMCAIAGHVSFAAPPDEQRVARMLAALRHRGPDGTGTATAAHACLGHNRLALLDRDGGAQPMVSPDGRFILTFNGEIYNHDELRSKLAGDWRFRTRSDSEVLLAALAAWDEDALPRLDGMFAFFLWDAHRSRGLGARDRLGVKPFAYAKSEADFTFASEAKALVAVGRAAHANHEAILEYLAAPCFSGVAAPMFAGLDYLQPGHLLRVDRDGVTTRRWWRHALAPVDDSSDARAAAIRERLQPAVTRALAADAPIGVFLSGGLDSTLLAALGKTTLVRAFTIAFAGHEQFDYAQSRIVISDDEPFAELAARATDLPRERVAVDRAALAADLPTLAAVDDALPAWEQELAQLHLARAAARHCKAVLVGDAADETHFGYHFLLDDAALTDPTRIVERFAGVPIRRDRLADPTAHFAAQYHALVAAAGHDWATPAARTLATTRLIVERWLPRLLHNGDVHCMAASLEARVPFADAALLTAAGRVPPSLALRDGVEKQVLRLAARGLVPEPIRVRKKSALPKDQACAPIYQHELRRLLDQDFSFAGQFVDGEALRPLCDPARRLDERERAALFRVICLCHWARHYDVRA